MRNKFGKQWFRALCVAVAAMAVVLFCGVGAFASDQGSELTKQPREADGTISSSGSLKVMVESPRADRAGVLKNVPLENVGIKLYFSENGKPANVTAADVWAHNESCFTLTGPDPKNPTGEPVEISTMTVKGTKEQNYILVVAQPTPVAEGQPGQLAGSSEYTLSINPELRSTSGASLGEIAPISFTTMDPKENSKASMILMGGMLAALIAFMVLNNYRKMKAEAEAAALLKANPYRISKERGITVDEAKALIEKAKEKNRKQLAKVGGKMPKTEEEKAKEAAAAKAAAEAARREREMELLPEKTYKVKTRRAVTAEESAFVAQRKAEAERKARAEAAKKAARARQQGGGSGGSGGKKKSSKGKGKKK
ncbi:MAG: hypothetical protein LBR44_04385 [Clostridiales Family XIII bacterium]|nr:hypothetical protein [Clostridiales Family XIII bacterium]